MNAQDATTAALQAIYDARKELTAELVVGVAVDPTSVLHDQFEWDDGVAGARYRLEQARNLIRRVTIVIEDTPVRKFPYIGSQNTYMPLDAALADTDWRDEMLRDFERDAERFARKWRAHKFVAERFAAWAVEQQQPKAS